MTPSPLAYVVPRLTVLGIGDRVLSQLNGWKDRFTHEISVGMHFGDRRVEDRVRGASVQ